MIRKKNGKSFFTVLIAWIIAIILLNTIVISSLVYIQIARLNKNQLLDKYQQSFYQTQSSIEYYLHSMVSAATALAADAELASYVKIAKVQTGGEQLNTRTKIRDAIIKAVNLNPSIQNISINSGNDVYSYNQWNFYQQEQSGISREKWFLSLQKHEIIQITVPEYQTANGLNLYFFACTLIGRNDVIVISMDGKIFHDLVNNADQKYSSTVCLFDGKGNLLYSNNPASSREIMTGGINLGALESGSEQKFASQNYFVVKSINPDTGWQLVSFTKSAAFRKYFNFIQPNLLLAILFTVIASIFLFVFIFLSISKPLMRIVSAMRTAVHSRFEFINVKSRYAEIQTIVDSFNKMNQDITQYISNIQQTNLEKRNIEKKLLEAQINPHFIYNTLAAIQWMAVINRDKPVAEMMASFVKLLKISLFSGDDYITLKEELEHIQNYIKIMQYRYNAHIETEIEAAPEILELHTLKFIIQPFVENCFYHAFPEDTVKARIILRCTSDLPTNCLLIEIEDNGKGISTSADIYDPMRRGIGIKNVDERIKLFCGEKYGVQIGPRQNGGTVVQVRQPIRTDGRSTGHD